MSRLAPESAGGTNVCAFLDMIAWSEGTTRVAASDDGYNVKVGGALFESYADHPREVVKINATLRSTAAGRYQLLSRYWDVYRKILKLSDFGPENQDRVAIQQLKETRAYPLIQAGKFEQAIARCKNIWASLPGAGYGQHENRLPDLLIAYQKSGGTLA